MISVIVVDDEVCTTNFLREYINNKIDGFTVTEVFSDGEAAIKYFEENDADIVLTDIRMSGKTGLDIARYIYENNIKTKVIFMSAFNEFEYAKKALEYGVSQYLCKAIDVHELEQALERAAKELNKTDMNEEYTRERFFLDLVMGTCNRNNIDDKLAALSIDINKDRLYFEIFEIVIDVIEKVLERWIYGKERFIEVICQYIEKSIESCYVIYSDFTDKHITVAVVCSEKSREAQEQRLKSEENNIYHDFGILTKIKLIEHFNINEIFNNKSWHKNSSLLLGISDDTPESKTANKEQAIAAAIKYIKENFEKDITSKDVAEAVFFNPIYFNKIFKTNTRMTVSDYILKVRMERAMELLKEKKKIVQIAKMVGYNSDRHFRRMFNLYTGYSVSDYRQKVLKMEWV